MLKLALFFAPIQSFVVTNIIKGLTLSNSILLLLMVKSLLTFRKQIITIIIIFSLAFISFFLVAQWSILVMPPKYDLSNVTFISKESIKQLFFRKSFITQSLYLLVVVSFFHFLLLYLRNYGKEKILNLSYLSIMVFIAYGYYEFFMYLVTGQNFDFISNRIAGEDFQVGLFQTINIAGVQIQRLKSLAGEPSMFAFTILPFFTLSVYLKRLKLSIFLLITLLLSTSTSAALGIFIWFILDVIYRENRILKIVLFSLLISASTILFYEAAYQYYGFIEAKLMLQHGSGIERFVSFSDHFTGWYNSNFINLLFGYGFGYVRSTDGLTTLLFNVGLIGVLIYITFFTLPYFLIKQKTDYIKGLYISNLSLLIVILISVPEFYYPHIWLFNALLWHEYFKDLSFEKRFISGVMEIAPIFSNIRLRFWPINR